MFLCSPGNAPRTPLATAEATPRSTTAPLAPNATAAVRSVTLHAPARRLLVARVADTAVTLASAASKGPGMYPYLRQLAPC